MVLRLARFVSLLLMEMETRNWRGALGGIGCGDAGDARV